MANDGVGGLFGMQLEALGDTDANATCFEQRGNFCVIGEIGTRGVAPRITTAAVLLAKKSRERRTVFCYEAKFFTNSVMPKFGQGFGHFNTEAVQHEVVGVTIFFEKFLAAFRDS